MYIFSFSCVENYHYCYYYYSFLFPIAYVKDHVKEIVQHNES